MEALIGLESVACFLCAMCFLFQNMCYSTGLTCSPFFLGDVSEVEMKRCKLLFGFLSKSTRIFLLIIKQAFNRCYGCLKQQDFKHREYCSLHRKMPAC